MCVHAQLLSLVLLSAAPWTVPVLRITRQEYWSGLPFSPPEDLPNLRVQELNLSLLHLLPWQMDSLLLSHQESL